VNKVVGVVLLIPRKVFPRTWHARSPALSPMMVAELRKTLEQSYDIGVCLRSTRRLVSLKTGLSQSVKLLYNIAGCRHLVFTSRLKTYEREKLEVFRMVLPTLVTLFLVLLLKDISVRTAEASSLPWVDISYGFGLGMLNCSAVRRC
jgi:hypothetical protein